MTVHITRMVAGELTKIYLTEKEVLEAKAFCSEMVECEASGRGFNKAFLLHKEVEKASRTYKIDFVLTRSELAKCFYAS